MHVEVGVQLRRNICVALCAFACALLLAVPCAFALDTGLNDDAPDRDQRAPECGGPQVITAVLYDDGELVIEKAPPPKPGPGVTSQDVAASEPDKTPGETDGAAANEPLEALEAAGTEKLASGSPPSDSVGEAPPPSGEVPPGKEAAATRTVVATYDNVSVGIDRPEHASWYGCRDKIKRVTFGNDVSPDTLAYWFAGLENLSKVDLKGLDSSHAKSMRSLFDGCTSLHGLDLQTLNTSQVTDMSRLFAGCSSLEALDLSALDTRNVTTMDGMFEGCTSIRSLDLSKFDTHSLTSVNGMLKGCKSLSALDVSSFSADLVSAMAVPTDNAGGYWKLNTPKDFVSGVVLRESTAAERMTAGLLSNASETQGGNAKKPVEDIDELAKPGPIAVSGLVAATAGEVGAAVASSAAPLLMPPSSPIAPELGGPDADDAFAQLVAQIQAKSNSEPGKTLADAMADAYLASRGLVAKPLSRLAAYAAGAVEAIAMQSPTNPMLPIGIPLNLFATTVLLFLVVPTTFLLLRDRR